MYNSTTTKRKFNRAKKRTEKNVEEKIIDLRRDLAARFKSMRETPDFKDLPYGEYMPRDWREEGWRERVELTKTYVISSYRKLSKLANQLGIDYQRPRSEAEIRKEIDYIVMMT